jgi:hypothetical protein
MGKRKRLKRVWIDIEYSNESDLNISLERIKNDILKGVESKEEILIKNKRDHYSYFKQWFPLKIHSYIERKENEKTIFIVKSKL